MKNKVLSLILALLMAASSASAVLADEAIADVDVEETAVVEEVAEAGQYDKAIAFLANYGIFKGISADDLGADLDVNRYQMALFVGRISTGWVDDSKWEDGPENWSEFTDISEGAVADYWGALSYANQKGIIEGYGNGKFGPYDGITYQNALTMVVRTLGYTGLDWPWGYIQKAVELGLTDGITDVAYTDELTRGETAQIIYNAMFAKTKAGSTLGLENFGVAFGWEKVIVTASDLNTFVVDKKDASLALKSDNTTRYYKDSNKPDAGTVAFQILNDDGTLADDVYYVEASELGLVGEHDDELAVGDAYYVLFEQDEDSNLVKVVAYESLLTETLVNAGKTDDEGEEVDYAIEEFLDEHTLVNKYSSNAYVNMTKSYKDEVMVFTANSSTIEYVASSDYAIAIDWATGDILVPVDADKDDDWKDDWKAAITDGKVDYDKIDFELKYSWNNTLKKYYEVEFDRDVEDFEDIAINWISEKEMEKLLGDYTYEVKATYKYGFNNAADSRLAKSAYAALKLFDTNLDGVADRGTYETYRLGYFENKMVDPGDCDCGNLPHYVVNDVNTIKKALDAYKAKEGKDATDIAADGISVREEGVTCKHSPARAWIVDDSALVAAVDEDGEETGFYAPAYVLYNYDAETGALKIVKNITAGEDVDSFVANGVVRAYNVNKGTITIGDETYDINGYSELLGNGFRYAADNAAAKAVYGAYLRSLFNQYVTFVVVDGELVHIAATGASTSKIIVVDSYAGLSSDGYIVVNGYDTDNLEYDQFRIGSYDGWEKGDYYYFLTEEKAEESFSKGAIYTISSYDATEDVYYVQLAGAFGKNEDKEPIYVLEDGVALDNTNKTVTIKADTDGYFAWTVYDEDADKTADPAYRKMKSSDKYVIVTTKVDNRPYANVIVYEGKLEAGWEVTGTVINTTDANKGLYVIVDANIVAGFKDTYKSGLVLLLNDAYTVANYDGAASEDWYLLGASAFEFEGLNLYNGKTETFVATNKDLDEGHIYFTQDDVVVEDLGVLTMKDIIKAAVNAYGNDDDETGAYWFGWTTITDTTLWNGDKDADEKLIYAATGATVSLGKFTGTNRFYSDIIDNDITIYGVEYDDAQEAIVKVKSLDKKAFEKIVKDYDEYAYNVYFVYSVDSKDVVAYVDLIEVDYEIVKDETIVYTNPVKVDDLDGTHGDKVNTEAYVEMSFGYTTVEKYIDGKLAETDYVLETIKLAVAGDSVEDATHAEIKDNGWYFGEEGVCFAENNEAVIKIAGIDVDIADVYSSMVSKVYGHVYDVEDCDLVKELVIPVEAWEYDAENNRDELVDVVITDHKTRLEVTVELWDGTAGDDDLMSSDGTLSSYTAIINWFWTTGKADSTYKFNDGFTANKTTTSLVFAMAK